MKELALIEKYDIVLDVLYSESGKSPSFDDIVAKLMADGYNIHWGEVMDILLTLDREKYIYQVSLVEDPNKSIRYLLSFNGKLLKELGGLEKKLAREKEKEVLAIAQSKSTINAVKWTKANIAIGLLISITTLSVVLFTCSRDTNKYNREFELHKKDTLRKV